MLRNEVMVIELKDEVVHALRRGVNFALGLPMGHQFGLDFVEAYIVAPCKGADLLYTDYESMEWWVRAHKYRYRTSPHGDDVLFYLNPRRYQVCIGLLEVAQALLRVDLLGDTAV